MTPMQTTIARPAGGRLRSAVTYLVLGFFLWSNVHPAFMASAIASPAGSQDASRHEPAPRTLERLLGETATTLERAQRKLERGQSAAAERRAVKELRQWLRDLDRQLRDELDDAEDALRTRGLTPLVLQRHADLRSMLGDGIDTVGAGLDAIDAAGSDAAFRDRVRELLAFLAQQAAPRADATFNPRRRTFEVPSAVPRPPRHAVEEFAQLGWQRKTEVAALGGGAGLLAAAVLAPSDAALLAASEDVQLTPAIQNLAEQLHRSPVEIYNWVRNHIAYVPSFGSMQGGELTLLSRRGNAFDTASLLIALLRASGVPARYVFGTIEVPAAQARSWIGGVALTQASIDLLAQGGVPVEAVYAGNDISALRFEHVWVEAWVDFAPGRGARNRAGDAWLAMDAAYKPSFDTPGLPIADEVPTDAQSLIGLLQTTAQIDTGEGRISGVDVTALQQGLDRYGERFDNYIDSVRPNATVADVLGSRGISVLEAPVLAAGLPYRPVVEGARFAELPDALRHRLRVQLYASPEARGSQIPVLNLERSLAGLSGRRLTLSFAPATSDDRAVLDSYFPQRHADGSRVQPAELPEEIPGYLIRVAAQIDVQGETPLAGGEFVLGATLGLTTALYDPSLGQWRQMDDALVAGEYQALVVDAQGIGAAQLEQASARLAATQLQLEAGDDGGNEQDLDRGALTGALLTQTALSYFAANDAFDALFQRAADIAAWRLPSQVRAVATVAPTYNFGVPVSVAFPGVALRADRVVASAASRKDVAGSEAATSYQRRSLERASAYAHLVLEKIHGLGGGGSDTPAIGASAIRALATSIALDQPVYLLGRNNVDSVLPILDLPTASQDDIRAAVNAELQAVTSQAPVSLGAWTGSGVVLADPRSGAGDYRLTGGAAGLLQRAGGMPWLALAEPFQAAVALVPAFDDARELTDTQAVLLGDAGSVGWEGFPAQQELVAGLFGAGLASVAAPDVLLDVVAVQAAALGTSTADQLSHINRAPVIFSSPGTGTQAGTPYHYMVSAADPEGDPLSYHVVQGPSAVSIDATGLVAWDAPVAGNWPITVRVGDGTLFTDQSYTLGVAAEPQPLAVQLSVNPPIVDAGSAVTLTVSMSGGSGAVSAQVTFGNQTLDVPAGGQVQVTASNTPGAYPVVATATDETNTVSAQATLGVRDPSDSTPPTAVISTPARDAVITAPTDIVGSIADDTALAYYVLLLRPAGAGDDAWFEIGRGNTPSSGGVLGRIDPSTLANGLYELALVTVDANGQSSGSLIPIEIDGDLKIGQFSLSFEDLSIEAGGIPVRVTRTYDTRHKDENLAFGYGWSVDYQDVRLRKNMTMGDGWTIVDQVFNLCIYPEAKHKVSIALPDGQLHRFEAVLEQECATGQLPPVRLVFNALGNTTSRLEIVDPPALVVLGENFYDAEYIEDGVFNPSTFKLTTEEGYAYYLRENAGIEKIVDPFGNTLTFTADGLVHSNGRSVAFTRDAQGRITAINDPSGQQVRYAYDVNGDLASVTDRNGEVSRLSYNRSHGLVDYTDARGVSVVKYLYDEEGRLIATVDAAGNRVDVNHDTDANREVVTNRRGFATTYVYDATGNVTEQIDALGQVTRYTYDAAGNETSVTDPLGQVTRRTFDGKGRTLSETDPLGHTTSYTYTTALDGEPGKIKSTTDARGHVTTYEYPFAWLNTITEPLGRVTSMRFDPDAGHLTSLNVGGLSTGYAYDANGNRIQETDGAGYVTTYSFDSNGRETGSSTARAQQGGTTTTVTTSRTLDAEGRVLSQTDGLGHVTRTTYLGDKPETETDAKGNVARYAYDGNARLIRTTYADGTTETVSYDANGNEIAKADRGGRTTRFEYDALDRLTKTIQPDGRITEQRYDAAGRLTDTVDARGQTTHNDYDAAGRLTQVTDALGNVIAYGYDENGNRTRLTDPKGQTTQYEYDALNRLIRTTYPDGTQTSVTWTTSGLKASETDASGHATRFGYDGKGQLTNVTQTNSGVDQITRYEYDEAGNKVKQTDARNRVTTWAYDAANRPIRRTLPNGEVESFGYDANGNLTAHSAFDGRATRFAYDTNNREIEKTDPDGKRITRTYTQSGQPQTVTDATGTTRYSYDAHDRLTSKQTPQGEIRYSYDENGNKLTDTVIPAQAGMQSRIVTYGYDAANRLASITDEQGKQTTYAYDENGNRSRISRPNDTTTVYQYDLNNRLTRIAHSKTSSNALLAEYRYTLAPNGQRTQVEESDTNGLVRTVAYTYDDLQRLTREQVTHRDPTKSRTTAFTYDAVGNRLTQTQTPSPLAGEGGGEGATSLTTTYTYDNNDRLLTEASGSSQTIYAYDDNGNTTKKEIKQASQTQLVTLYSYDSDNRLTEVRQGQSAQAAPLLVAYRYDADGNRIKTMQADGTSIDYLVDTNRQYAEVLEEVQVGPSGTTSVAYIHGDDLLRQMRAGHSTYYHQDGLGSTRVLTDAQGIATDTYAYEAFGEPTEHSGLSSVTHLFAGEQVDPNTGFYYLRARWMNPELGRFLALDSFQGITGDPASLHKYLYANADPVDIVDPSGHIGVGEFMAGIAVGAIVNASIGVATNALNPSAQSVWGDIPRDLAVGAIAAPVGGAIARILGPVLRGMSAPVFRAIGRMNSLKLVGRPAWERALIRMSRVFVTTNKGYPSVSSTLMGKALIRLFPQYEWQQHHIFIQQAWFRAGSAHQLFDDVLANRGLQRLGHAGWNLMPIPASLNGWLGSSPVATQLLATFMYSVAVFGPLQLVEMVNEAEE